MIPLGNNLFAEVDEIDLLPALMGSVWSLAGGYAKRGDDYLHWFVARRMGLVWTTTIDHKDRNKLNCRRSNLQVATQSEQAINTKLRSTNKTGYKCIEWREDRKRWIVRVRRNYIRVTVGSYKTLEQAVTQRDAYLRRHSLNLESI